MAQKISEHFTLEEFTRSATASRLGIENKPNQFCTRNIVLLVKNVLEPLRMAKGAIVISSGFRCPELNKAVGGVPTSRHQSGQACDIFLHGDMNYGWDLFEYIEHNLPFDQLIMEHNAKGTHWIHVSFSEIANSHIVIRNLEKK